MTPNQSLHWEDNLWVVLAVSVVILLVALPIALQGGWVVLPFAVIQILALTTSLYLTLRKLNYREVITLQNGQILLQRGRNHVETSWVFPESSVKVLVEEQDRPMSSPDIDLVAEGHCYHLGEFLNRADRFILAHALKNQLNLRVTNLSSFHRVNF
ncbi:MAG: DUF2244 domain-containing protein [Porticoccus sp.]|nr:DUF2244 domain-containing protein [Porticoccus sp.]MBQ0806729.1 DUF2244 domain-containing protein [Porticoccus sp.]